MRIKAKYKNGELAEYRSRFVAGGNKQECKDYYKFSTSSTVKTMNLFIMLAEAACKRAVLKSMNIESAYLEADMDEAIYMRIDFNTARLLAASANMINKFIVDC